MSAAIRSDGDLDLVAMGRRIVAAYEAKRMNRRQFVRAIDGHYQQVMKWEKGEAAPTLQNLVRTSVATGVSVEHLMYGNGPESDLPASSPTVPREFVEWLASPLAPADLTDEEREALGSWTIPGPHPGPAFYGVVLATWRAMRSTKR